jgi:hypothetical protein
LGVIVAACSTQHDRDFATNRVVHWSVVNAATDAVVADGCAAFADRLRGAISFRAAQGDEILEEQTWELVERSADHIPEQTNISYWCSDQSDVETMRTPIFLSGQDCLAPLDADPPVMIHSVEIVNAVTPTAGSGRRLRFRVLGAGPLTLTATQPCWNEATMDTSDASGPPPWTELTILP